MSNFRPFCNPLSRAGFIPKIDTRIKQKDVVDALAKFTESRNAIFRIDSKASSRSQKCSQLADYMSVLPGELRNNIYRYALDIGTVDNPTTRVPRHPRDIHERLSGLGLLRASKLISAEARTLMEAVDIAYIPVMGSIQYETILQQVLIKGLASLDTYQTTIFASLTTYRNVHIHLHTTFKRYPEKPETVEPEINLACAYNYGRLRQILVIHTAASKSLAVRWPNRKRHAIVHFDHHFSDWCHMVRSVGHYSVRHLAQIMGRDKHTEWEVRYYTYTANQEREDEYLEDWDERLKIRFESLVRAFEPYDNIELVAEVYGELKWSVEEGRKNVTRSITPSSVQWSSWPDYVPWRLKRPGVV